ncbi:MAG: cytochrome c biogenesis protein CcsA [Eubacteriaceae bacterium]|nr:cytochrome c biogenesis protein CcsA [Eubacteriaceae bacterium]
MNSGLLFISVLLCACCALISFISINFKYKKTALITLWSVSFVIILISVILLLYYLINVNLKYLYVYSHSSKSMAVLYRMSSLCAGEEGCFLLWAFIMSAAGFLILLINKNFDYRAFGIFCIISFFIFLICFMLNPFEKISVVPSAGLGIEKILQNPWMAIHPPLIFLSYTAMAVLFSLWPIYSAYKNETAINLIKLWINISMFFLTAGLISGSVWAYHSYAYGKVWAWDSMENISLITWLVLCAFIHRDKYDTQAVCILPFATACFSVFLARSGVLDGVSYHVYTERNIIITQFILFFIFGAVLFLDVQRRRYIKSKKYEAKEVINYKNRASDAIFIFACFILLGTIAPIISKTHTTAIYYVTISMTFAAAAITILVLKDKEIFKKRGALIIVLSAAAAAVIGIAVHQFKILWMLFLLISFLPLFLFVAGKSARKYWKYYLAHIGLVFLIIGAVASNAFGTEGYVLKNSAYNINISGFEISAEEIDSSDIIILSKFNNDIVIKSANRISNAQTGVLIPYVEKPLIILFWAGCIIILMQPVIQIVLLCKNKEDKSQKKQDDASI